MKKHSTASQRIILIGPCGAGKSSVGRALASALGCMFVDMDEVRELLYKDTDYSEETANDYMSDGVLKWHDYVKPYEFYSVNRILADFDNAVIAFGGGQSVYDNTPFAEPFIRMMKNEKYVFLLLPSEDEQESLRILDSRIENEDERILNRLFVNSRTTHEVGIPVITCGKDPEEVALVIIELIKGAY